MIVNAQLSDAKELTEIALNSKAFWGYSDEQLKSWEEELTVSRKMIDDMFVFKFVYEEKSIGFYILNQPEKDTIELEFLFVNPAFIGKGIGKQLLHHSFSIAKKVKADSLILVADPNAVPFYQSQGFYKVAVKESLIFGRFLPILKKDLG